MAAQAGQRVIILAPRSTIAREVTQVLRDSGARIAAIGRNLSGLKTSEFVCSATCDLTDPDAVQDALVAARDALGGATGILNCAGSMALKPAHLTSLALFRETVEANLLTAFAAVRAARAVFDAAGGSVVLISSAAAKTGMANHEAIAAAKSGLEGLVRAAAATYASRNIRFNAVAPGLVATALSRDLVDNEGSRRISEQLHPLGRIGTPGDIASAICWLLDPGQSWITGQVIGVDGGLAQVQPRPRMAPSSSSRDRS